MSETQAWWKEAVVYQVYPRSFADSNGDGIGDLNGVTAHLPYLQTLGVDVIWLSPVYASPNDDNGYDISDYQAIMPEFGTMEDFDRLLAETHRLGMKLVMDLVSNHTSDEHRWFVESRKSKDNPYRDYYIWRDGQGDNPPNNWGGVFSGSAWQKDEATGQYYLHLFSRKQPDLNWANSKVRDEIFTMMEWWCQKGVDGFRMDVIGSIGKESYEDGTIAPGGLYGDFNPYCVNTPTTHRYLQEMNQRVLSKHDLFTVGETSEVTPADACKFAAEDRNELRMVFQFEHVSLCGNGALGKWSDDTPALPALRKVLNRWQTELEGKAWNSLYLNNHDQPRSVSRFGNDSPLFRERSAKMLATLIHMMKGTPYVYQGEELGMTNICFKKLEDYRDVEVFNAWKQWVDSGIVDGEDMLRYFARVSRDNARTPMQWSREQGAGFTTGEPWIRLNPNYIAINAQDQLNDPDSVFHYYQKLIALRHKHPIIVYGRFVPLLENDEHVYAYQRRLDGETLTVACNFSSSKAPCTLFDHAPGQELISNYSTHQQGVLQPYEARVLLHRV